MKSQTKNALKYSVASPLFLSLLLVTGAARCAYALPQNGAVAAGTATISPVPHHSTTMTVTQSSDKAIINWKTFDIKSNETVNFVQPSATAVALNRVVNSQAASQILGRLKATGTLMLVNPRGIVFGEGSQVNVGSLVATTSDIADDDFMDGKYNFTRSSNASSKGTSVSNSGTITAADGGLVAMVADNVLNEGTIVAKFGKLQLASGDTFGIDLNGDGLINLQASDKVQNQLVQNSGLIRADGGEILMTTAAATNALDSVINMSGTVQADTIDEKAGRIVLTANEAAVTPSPTPTLKTKISTPAPKSTINITGNVLTRGSITGTGSNKVYENGGSITVNAASVTIGQKALLNASGAKNGGSINTYGHDYLNVSGSVVASGVDKVGNWYAGSKNTIEIAPISSPTPTFFIPLFVPNSFIAADAVSNALSHATNVVVTAENSTSGYFKPSSILVHASIIKWNPATTDFVLNAQSNIDIYGSSIVSKNGKINFVANADSDADGHGSVYVAGQSLIRTAGGSIILGGKNKPSEEAATGVYISDSTLDAQGGDISIIGSNMYGFNGYSGVVIQDSTIKTASSGDISIKGTGYEAAEEFEDGPEILRADSYAGRYAQSNNGVYINNSEISTGSGDINITGVGATTSDAAGDKNYGIYAQGSTLKTREGNITLRGTSAMNENGAILQGDGIFLRNDTISAGPESVISLTGAGTTGSSSGSAIVLKLLMESESESAPETETFAGIKTDGVVQISGASKVLFTTDSIKVDGRMYVNTLGNTTFRTYSSKTSIGVAGGAGALQITKAILDDVNAQDSVTIGDLGYGDGAITANAYDWRSDTNFLANRGNFIINGVQTLGSATFFAHTVNGDVVIGPNGGITSQAEGTAITLAASGGVFKNQSGSDALEATNGRWLIYTNNPFKDTMDGLVSAFHRFSCVFGGSCPAFPESGNGNLYAYAPKLTFSVDDATTMYGQAAPSFTYSLTGYILGDTMASDVISGTIKYKTTYTQGDNVGSYDITAIYKKLVSELGYVINTKPPVTNVGGLTVTKAPLTVTANNKLWVFGQAFPTLDFSALGYVNGDDASDLTGALQALLPDPLRFGTYGIAKGTLDAMNYDITYVPGEISVVAPGGVVDSTLLNGIRTAAARGAGYNGVLLAMSNQPRGGLAGLAPAAGGNPPAEGSMTPDQLSNLAPAAGGNGPMGNIVPLIECSAETPCQIAQ